MRHVIANITRARASSKYRQLVSFGHHASPSSASSAEVSPSLSPMAVPPQHFQPQYELQEQQGQQQSLPFRNLYSIDGRISPPVTYYNLQDQSQNPSYDAPLHAIGFAPSTVPAVHGNIGGADVQFNFGLEPPSKRLKEQEFFDNASQITSIDFLQARSVSTGLGLSLDNTPMTSSGDSALFSLITDDIERELQQQDDEIDRFLTVQAGQLQQAIMEKVHSNQLQTISLVEDKVLRKLHEKEAEVKGINRKNKELEEHVEQLSVQANAWQQQARYSEHMSSALQQNLQQIYAQSRDSKEGCGDSEVDDTATCHNGCGVDFLMLGKAGTSTKQLMMCKVCGVNEVCMLLLPCRHLCLCKFCEGKISSCPLCLTSKYVGMEVYMS